VRFLAAATGCAVVLVVVTTVAWGAAWSFLFCVAVALVAVVVGGWVGLDLGEQRLRQDHESRNGLPVARVYDTTGRD
jgi:hypothetical protein